MKLVHTIIEQTLPPIPGSEKNDKAIAKESNKLWKDIAKKLKVSKWITGFDGKFDVNVAPKKMNVGDFRKAIVPAMKTLAKKHDRKFKDGGTRGSQGEFWVSDLESTVATQTLKGGFALKSF